MVAMLRNLRVPRIAVSVCSVASFVAASANAQGERLGTIQFPNSGSAAAQAPFLRGMMLYWSFEYGRAAEAFREAQKADPSFTLAYVGEALTFTHQVWNEQDVAAGRAALEKLAPTTTQRLEKARTLRERRYGELAEVLYGAGAKPWRDTLFTSTADRMTREFPDDDEAKVFHALGLLGLNQGVREFTSYMKAGAVAADVLRRNADHPGAAHFVIHAFDDPVHAPLGLWAARLYSRIAPAAPHAQHMTSHIFVAMGMWDDVISQNVIAAGHDHHAYRAGHYTWWLGYGYLQAGRYADAKAHLATMRGNFAEPTRRGEASGLVMSRAHFVIDAERWSDDVLSWKLGGTGLTAAADSFVVGYAALKRGDVAAATRIAGNIPATAHGVSLPGDAGISVGMLSKQLHAAIASAAGRHAEAVSAARNVAAAEEAMPFEFGPPQFPKPTHEMLGEVLLAAGQPGEAKTAFEKSLSRTPGRSRSLVGLARAAAASGDKATAERAVSQLRANWHAADNDLPELAELGRLVAAGGR